jgi:hypothetical protein
MFMIERQSHEGKEQSSELAEEKRQTWKDVLLGDGPRFELPFPKRGNRRTCKKLEAGENPHP